MPSAAGRRSDLRFLIAALLHSDGARSTTDVSPYSASRQHVEVRLAHEPELLPGLTAIVALDKAERIGQFGTRRRVPAAVQRIARGGEAYVVVRRPLRLGPNPVRVQDQATTRPSWLGSGAVFRQRYRTVRRRVRVAARTSSSEC
jgi:hypothetical protein